MSSINYRPALSLGDAEIISQDYFGITGEIKKLPSERDQNFQIASKESGKLVLKISNAAENLDLLRAQNEALFHLSKDKVLCPKVLKSKSGNLIERWITAEGASHYIRMVTYIEGQPYGTVAHYTDDLYAQIGTYLGKLNKSLDNFDHSALYRDFHWDIQKGPEIISRYSHLVNDPDLKLFLNQVSKLYMETIVPILPDLRKNIIHNDLNNFNVIVEDCQTTFPRTHRVAGVIDFGDMIHSYRIADLAVAIAYAVLEKPDPLKIASLIAGNYYNENPLDDNEITVLFGMICMRLCMSICLAAYQSQNRPDDAYLTISQQPIHNTATSLLAIPPLFAEASFRNACGLLPVPKTILISDWIDENSDLIYPIFGELFSLENSVGIDLSVGSSIIHLMGTTNSKTSFINHIKDNIMAAGVKFGISRFAEPRIWDTFTNDTINFGNIASKTIHLGIDLFTEPGTPVYSPLDGRIQYIKARNYAEDEESVLIIKHVTDQGDFFYSLYRHLIVDNDNSLNIGQIIRKGTRLGVIDSKWSSETTIPHLQIQLITNLLGLGVDFPELITASEFNVWVGFSMDPHDFLHIPSKIFQKRRTKVETLGARRKYIGRNLSLVYQDPLKIERGWMQYLFDENGCKYLDAYNNVPHVGHCHPRVVQAGIQQSAILNTNTRYLHDNINIYAEKLLSTLPPPLDVCYFVNSGSEANELALRIARGYTHFKDVIVLSDAYHGNTTTLIDISPYKHNGPGRSPPPQWVHTIPVPDLYRGQYRSGHPDAVNKYILHAKNVISTMMDNKQGLACFIAETCPSVGGQIFLPEGFLAQIYSLVRAAGGVCIADEVQTGFGRIGTHFYAFEAHDVIPDIVVLGKPIGNGHPIGAVITTSKIADAFNNGMEYFSTFGGNPVSCAIGISVLVVIAEEGLQEHALDVGNYLLNGLRDNIAPFPIIGDIRGSGLFVGVECVRDKETLEPATEEANFIVNNMRKKRILLGTDGPHHNVLKIRPPMPFNRKNAESLLSTLAEILHENS